MEIDDLKKRYEKKIQQQFSDKLDADDLKADEMPSSEYLAFKQENLAKHLSLYEKACQISQKIVALKPDPVKSKTLIEDIELCHLQVTPGGVMGFAILAPLLFILITVFFSYVLTGNLFLVFLSIVMGAILIMPCMNLPSFFALNWRMRASNQMILGVFYIVTYMRHTSNLERAIEFASHHLSEPLSMDLKKIIWDVETEKYDTILASLENYLARWKDHNDEFVESMHIIVGSLYETSETKRQELLDKALDLILEETYDKMLHYAHNLQSPITALVMLGIVLPILGLVMLPLMVNFMSEVKWYYIAILFNILLPAGIFYMTKTILAKRPSGYGGIEVDSNNPIIRELSSPYVSIGKTRVPLSILWVSVIFGIALLLVGFAPVILHAVGMQDVGFGKEVPSAVSSCGQQYCLLGYKEAANGENVGSIIGPFGLGATLLSLFVPLGIAGAIGLYYYVTSYRVIKFRDETKKLEEEFTGALFQLANRLGDGLPPEVAFERVGQSMPDSRSGMFFKIISNNVRKLGMGIQEAIFNPKNGALVSYPSTLIESSMKILTQSAQKGPKVASNAIDNVARYIQEMNRVNERLQDLMAEVIASMKSQISFLMPIIMGIVVGITSMITAILGQLGGQLKNLNVGDSGGVAAGFNAQGLVEMFGDGIPAFYIQIVIGIYVIQVIILLTILINTIQNGVDKINEKYLFAKNLLHGVGLYLLISFGVTLVFNLIAGNILQTALGG